MPIYHQNVYNQGVGKTTNAQLIQYNMQGILTTVPYTLSFLQLPQKTSSIVVIIQSNSLNIVEPIGANWDAVFTDVIGEDIISTYLLCNSYATDSVTYYAKKFSGQYCVLQAEIGTNPQSCIDVTAENSGTGNTVSVGPSDETVQNSELVIAYASNNISHNYFNFSSLLVEIDTMTNSAWSSTIAYANISTKQTLEYSGSFTQSPANWFGRIFSIK